MVDPRYLFTVVGLPHRFEVNTVLCAAILRLERKSNRNTALLFLIVGDQTLYAYSKIAITARGTR